MSGGNPTPAERADLIVKRLEEFIRDGKVARAERGQKGGISFRVWQDLARVEIANTVADAERTRVRDDRTVKRVLATAGASLASLGFLGAGVTFGDMDNQLAANIGMVAGLLLFLAGLELPFRRAVKGVSQWDRHRRLRRIRELDQQVRELERHLDRRRKALEKRHGALDDIEAETGGRDVA